eukprot:13767304-Alexandrium_andersonii.AAC.1
MSASLVGSEMCIRDRPSRPAERGGPQPAAKVAGASGAARCSTGVNLQPVSYTHLTLPTICSV